MNVLGASLSSITPYQKHIPCKNNRKETSDHLIPRKEPIPETLYPIKISQGDSIMPPEKESPHKTSQSFLHKEDYQGDTDENNCNTYDSRSNNETFVNCF